MSLLRTAIPPMPSASCRCSIATSPALARHRGRLLPMAATPAAPISPPPRPAASPMSRSTRSAASPLPTWSKPVGVPPAAQLPRRHRGRHLLLQARLWRRTLHLARSRPFQGLHLVRRGGYQRLRPPPEREQRPVAPPPIPPRLALPLKNTPL